MIPAIDFCLFISSSDNTYDVYKKLENRFKITLPWNCVKTYVGCNTPKVESCFELVLSPVENWRSELKHQIQQLPKEIDYIILLLDDFWFKQNLTFNELNACLEYVKLVNADYLRLVPLKRSVLGSLLLWLEGLFQSEPRRLKENEPYYSSLQVAIWRRDYLLLMLDFAENIWHFEHLVKDKSKHFVIRRKVANYTHIVEKGKWLWYANKYIKLTPKDLEYRPLNVQHNFIKSVLDKIKFKILGYSIARFNGKV